MNDYALLAFVFQMAGVVAGAVWVISSIKSTTAVLNTTIDNLKEAVHDLSTTLDRINLVQPVSYTHLDVYKRQMRYYNEVKERKEFLGETAKKTYTKEIFAITQENYRRVLKNKTLDGYREFFGDNYQQK